MLLVITFQKETVYLLRIIILISSFAVKLLLIAQSKRFCVVSNTLNNNGSVTLQVVPRASNSTSRWLD
jgi:hypothetical protein